MKKMLVKWVDSLCSSVLVESPRKEPIIAGERVIAKIYELVGGQWEIEILGKDLTLKLGLFPNRQLAKEAIEIELGVKDT